MPFPFVYLCDLLDKLEGIHVREVAYLPKDRRSLTKDALMSWFRMHRWRINAQDTDGNAVLMMLRPERQTDREYGLEAYMEQILARIFKMPTEMYQRLKSWRDDAQNHGDLGSRLCKVLQDMKIIPPSSTASKISADEIDQALLRIAIFNAGSSVAVKSLKELDETPPDRIDVLEGLYLRLQPREAKWLTRIVLKNFGPVTLPSGFPVPGNVTHLPNSLPVMLNFPTEPPSPKRRTRTRIKRGVGSNDPTHTLPTPPTSSLNLPPQDTGAVAEKPAPIYCIGWDPRSSTLSATVKVTAQPTPAKSSPHQNSSAKLGETAHKPEPPPSFFDPSISIPTNSQPTRRALGQISSNIPSGGSQSQQSQSRSPEKNSPANNPITSSNNQAPQIQTPPDPTPKSPIVFSKGKCLLTQTHTQNPTTKQPPCQFSSSLLIVSPCLLTNTHLLSTLIPHHGAHYLTSLSQLSHPTIPRRTKSGRRVKKFILVDITRPEKAVRFCKDVEKAVEDLGLGLGVGGGGWRTRGGRRQRVPIFDWRVLESAVKVERGCVLGFDFWERHFQGVV
ncbi:hypothetical protein ONS95_009024 [Cadophora gregata]|uniref:uncharacterized protein n=1 Tax=Cadophora gregata TaxID=51156 RepID=UPI0026DAA50F|nr:uncharacterized protein ONS95_009024 [Cadophora gregata]KAK0124038.1 hypothetical protein ONS95_009024 [Cadophora gregata]KAK0130371.1 hypothetical protein ONS96_000892 [Cadophora gregata f. sp. sojae]